MGRRAFFDYIFFGATQHSLSHRAQEDHEASVLRFVIRCVSSGFVIALMADSKLAGAVDGANYLLRRDIIETIREILGAILFGGDARAYPVWGDATFIEHILYGATHIL